VTLEHKWSVLPFRESRTMKGLRGLAAVALFSAPCGVTAASNSVTPIQKCIQMLTGMLEKSKAEKHEEQVAFAAFNQFCDSTTKEKQDSIKEADEHIEMLKADIQKFEADVDRLEDELEQHHTDVAGWEEDEKDAAAVRGVERSNYTVLHEDYTESVEALTQAMRTLQQQNYDRKGAASLLERVTSLSNVPPMAQRTIQAFLARDMEDDFQPEAPTANAYEFKSGDIITMLESLKDKFTEERRELEKEEMSRRHAHESLAQDLGQSVKASEREIADDTQAVAKNKQMIAEASGTLEDTTKTREDDQKYLDDLTATCTQKTDDFGARQTLRGEEIDAIEKAVEIIGSKEVSGSADKHLPAMLQKSRGSAFVQLRASATNPENQERAAAYLRGVADKIGSRVLSTIAMRAAEDPFAKVKKLIEELVQRLIAEATEEAEHKGWCDTELGTNEVTRKEKSSRVETLHAEIEGLQSKIASLTKDISETSKAIAELNAAVATATQIRDTEKTDNELTIKEAQDGQTAIADAQEILNDFYEKAGGATALVQKMQKSKTGQEPPPFAEEPYQGQQQSGGVLAMLDVIKSDFARLEKDTESAESTAQSDYDGFMNDSEVDKTAKDTDKEHFESEKQQSEMTLSEKETDVESEQAQLDAALQYYEKLKPSCVDTGMSYEDRVARRKEEIESLKEALTILNGEM